MTDARIARIERGTHGWQETANHAGATKLGDAVLADLRAWQEIAERHTLGSCGVARDGLWVSTCLSSPTCPDRQAADAALDRLNALWGTDEWPR